MVSAPVFCPRFVGRKRELAFLIERRRELAKAHGSIVFVSGDAGIGKSRLVREFLHATGKSRGRVAIARCRAFGTASYEPLVELLETLAPESAELIPAANQDAQLKAIAGAFLAAASKNAIVAIIEDLHWSDTGTLAVLGLLAERLPTQRVLLIATYRGNELGPQHPQYIAFGALLRAQGVTRVDLAPLASPELRDFIDATLRVAPAEISTQLRRQVAHVAEGNPFFTEELLKSVVDRAVSHRADGSLPTSIHAAIVERLRPIGEADRAILTHAAVIGRQFDVELLARTLDTDAAAVLPALQRARTLQIVEETDDPSTFRFRHALTREVIYGELLVAQRRQLHEHIALALEAQTREDRWAQALGYHWWAAGNRAKALAFGERSGDVAQMLHSYADSIANYERTLELLEAEGPDAARICVKAGLSYFRSGFMDRAIAYYRRAWAFYRTPTARTTTADAAFVFRLARNLSAALFNDGHPRESVAFLGEAVAVVVGCGDRYTSDFARLTYATYLIESGAIEATRATLRGIDREFVAGDTGLTLMLLLATCWLAALEGDIAALRRAGDELCAIEAHPADESAFVDALGDAGIAALLIGEMPTAQRALRRAADAAPAEKNPTLHGDLLLTIALERVLSGSFEEARVLLARGLPLIGDVRSGRHNAALAALTVGTVLDDAELLAHEPAGDVLDSAFETGWPHVFGPLAAVCAQLLAARGEHAAARRLVLRGIRAATTALPLFGTFPLVVVAAQVCERTDASEIRTLCNEYITRGHAPKYAAELAQGILLERFGDAQQATEAARRAAAGFAEIGWPFYEALALEVAGDARAAQQLRTRIGYRAKPALRSSRAQTALESVLTARELEVARLVAGGGSNRQIAATLSVSVKLVEKHLSSVYEKLALTSRSQLTARMIADDGEPRGSAARASR